MHEADYLMAFLADQPADISYRFLKYEDVATLKIRRAMVLYDKELGLTAEDLGDDGDYDKLKADLVAEFGNDFLKRNGWAIPAFGHRPTDAQVEEAANLDHLRPHYYLASDAVHATPKGLMNTIQQIDDQPILMSGPTNAGLAEPGHSAALSLARCTITLLHFAMNELRDPDDLEEQISTLFTTNVLLQLTDRIGQRLLEAHERLVADEEALVDQSDSAT